MALTPVADEPHDIPGWLTLPTQWRSPVRRPRPGTHQSSPLDPSPGETNSADHDLAWAASRLVLEILQGRRPAGQLEQLCAPEAAAAMHPEVGQPCWRQRRLESVRVSRPSSHAIEASLRFSSGTRSIAAAQRLEIAGRHWVCTYFAVLQSHDSWPRLSQMR